MIKTDNPVDRRGDRNCSGFMSVWVIQSLTEKDSELCGIWLLMYGDRYKVKSL